MAKDNPKDLIGVNKPSLSLVSPLFIIELAEVMKLGAKKYGPYNWREHPVRETVYYDACLRHIYQAMDGTKYDEESGNMHLAHAAACLMILIDAEKTNCLKEDAFNSNLVTELLKLYTREDKA